MLPQILMIILLTVSVWKTITKEDVSKIFYELVAMVGFIVLLTWGGYWGCFYIQDSVRITAKPPWVFTQDFVSEKEFRVTAYCPCEKCCGKWADGVTASGHVIQTGDKFVAAPPEIPFGTVLDIPGYGTVPVLDRGGVIKGKRLDVFFDTHQEALNWGVKHLIVQMQGEE